MAKQYSAMLGTLVTLCVATAPGCSGEVSGVSFNPAISDAPGSDVSQGGAPSNTIGGPATGATGGASTPAPIPSVDANGQFPPAAFNFDGAPLYSRAIQLTNDQWAHAVKDVLKLADLPSQANSFLRPVGGYTQFENNEIVLKVSNDMRESYQLAAAEIAEQVGASDAALQRVAAGSDAQTFVRTLGRRAYRRPLTTAEETRYVTLFETGGQLSGSASDFVKGAGLVIEAMIQSPYFLYRTELQPTGTPLNGYEVASKLSFWLRGTTPSDELLDQAADGELDTVAGVESITKAMLNEAGAAAMAVDMNAQLFKFLRFRDVIKSSPDYDPEMNDELDVASRMFFERIFTEKQGLRDILLSTEGFVGPKLAKLYGITPAPATVSLRDFGAERVGFFSQIPYLMVFADDGHSDAIHRGLYINYQVLCAKLPLPDVVPSLSPAVVGQTDRERMEKLTGIGTCGASCHGAYINPLGYAFENFDGLGRVRNTDNDQPVDTSSSYPFSDGTKTFAGAPELMRILAENEQAHACYAKNLMSYGLQRDIIASDQVLVDTLADVSMSSGGSIQQMILELVKSDAFRTHSGAM